MIFKGPPVQMRPRAKTPVFLTKHSTIMTKKNWVDHRQSQTCFFFSARQRVVRFPDPLGTWDIHVRLGTRLARGKLVEREM